MAKRVMPQRMAAPEIFMHFLGVHQAPEDPGEEGLENRLAPLELAGLVLSEVVIRLVGLASACRLVPVPQKWIGSSVALGSDSGRLPSARPRINICGWLSRSTSSIGVAPCSTLLPSTCGCRKRSIGTGHCSGASTGSASTGSRVRPCAQTGPALHIGAEAPLRLRLLFAERLHRLGNLATAGG